jgi:hypothetical protein
MHKGLSYYSHAWSGLFWFDMPFAVLLTLVFHHWVRVPLLEHLPGPLYSRFILYPNINWFRSLRMKWPVVLLSVFIGVLTHLSWDGLVHQSADYLYEHQGQFFAFKEWKHHSKIYATVHIAHSLIGLAAILAFVKRMPVSATNNPKPITKFWITILGWTILISALRFLVGSELSSQDKLVSVIAAFLLALGGTCSWMPNKHAR